jgi:hypothetical protein
MYFGPDAVLPPFIHGRYTQLQLFDFIFDPWNFVSAGLQALPLTFDVSIKGQTGLLNGQRALVTARGPLHHPNINARNP